MVRHLDRRINVATSELLVGVHMVTDELVLERLFLCACLVVGLVALRRRARVGLVGSCHRWWAVRCVYISGCVGWLLEHGSPSFRPLVQNTSDSYTDGDECHDADDDADDGPHRDYG